MKFKKLIMSTIFLLSILLISTVSATSTEDIISSDVNDNTLTHTDTDNNEKKTNSPDTILNENCDKNPIKSEEKSFTALNNKINEKINSQEYQIELTDNYNYISSDSTNGIKIDGNLFNDGEPKTFTIKGNGKTIDAKGQSEIFIVKNGVHLIIENLKLINGYSRYNSVITVGDSLSSCQLTIINSTFNNNKVTLNGGVIKLFGNLTVINSTFNNNKANNSGGAISIDDKRPGQLTIINSKFINNTAHNCGGAIFAGNTDLFIINSKFIKNTAENCGGAIRTSVSNSTIINTELTNNIAENCGGAISISGDIIHQKYSNIIIENSKINDNNVNNTGGAINIIYSNLTITNTLIQNNKANKSANGIYIFRCDASIRNCDIINNDIYQSNSNVDLTGSKIRNISSETNKKPKVIKKTVTIIPSKKTFRAKVKTKKYTVTLKVGKKVIKNLKVTLKIKGKNYKATTNKKGVATFKITNLKKKGTYKAIITYKGNNIYKKSTKKVKIKIKR